MKNVAEVPLLRITADRTEWNFGRDAKARAKKWETENAAFGVRRNRLAAVTRPLRAKIAVLAVLCSCANVAHASDYSGYVQSVVQVGTRAFIYVSNGWFGTDHCGTGRPALIVYADTTTNDGRSFIALAVSAKLTGNQVYAAGNATCWTGNTPNGGVSESINVLWLQ